MTSGPIDRIPGRPGSDKNRCCRPSLFGLKQRMTSCLVLAENILEVNIYFNIYLEEDIVRIVKAEFVAEVRENIYLQIYANCIDQLRWGCSKFCTVQIGLDPFRGNLLG